jgi:hypothetical protein
MLRDVARCALLHGYQCTGGISCLHLQEKEIILEISFRMTIISLP